MACYSNVMSLEKNATKTYMIYMFLSGNLHIFMASMASNEFVRWVNGQWILKIYSEYGTDLPISQDHRPIKIKTFKFNELIIY